MKSLEKANALHYFVTSISVYMVYQADFIAYF